MTEYDTLATRLITNKKLTLKLGNQKPDSVRKGIYRAIIKLNKVMADHGVEYPTAIKTQRNSDGTITYLLNESKSSSRQLDVTIIEEDINGNSNETIQEILGGT